METKKTKIIATVGPATDSIEQLTALYDAGVNTIRFNFSHAKHENVEKIIERIKSLNKSGRTHLSILLDTKGPEIRTGELPEKVRYEKDELIKIVVDKSLVTDSRVIYCDYQDLLSAVKKSDIIRIDSGLFDVQVVKVEKDHIVVKALNGSLLGSRKHVNLPGIKTNLPGVTDKDKEDILFGIKNGIDFVAMSFVRSKENVIELREFLKQNNAEYIRIVSKIENQEGLDNVDEIIAVTDGIMVARGDLGIEVPIEKLPIYQKSIVKKCRQMGKFVIIATHLLETMSDYPYPTRAEVSDIFNCVIQKADATMLSGETTTGKYPLKSVDMMRRVIIEAEKNIVYDHEDFSDDGILYRALEKKLLIKSAIEIGEQLGAKCVIVFSKSGLLASFAAAFRPNIPLHVFTNRLSTTYFMNLLFGVIPHYIDVKDYSSGIMDISIKKLLEEGVLQKTDKVITVKDVNSKGKNVSTMQVINIENYLN